MSCEQARRWMMEQIDGSIDAAAASQLVAHLADCADCRAEWERLEALDALFCQAPMARPARGFTGRIMARIDRRRWFGQLVLGGAALTVGGIVAVALLVGPSLLALPEVPTWLGELFDGRRLLAAYLGRLFFAFAESLCATIDVLLLPLMTIAALGFLVAIGANLAWLRLVQRLQRAPARVPDR